MQSYKIATTRESAHAQTYSNYKHVVNNVVKLHEIPMIGTLLDTSRIPIYVFPIFVM